MRVQDSVRRMDEVLGASRAANRLSDVFGYAPPKAVALVPASSSASFKDFIRGAQAAPRRDVPDGAGTLIGALSGAYIFRDTHPVLGVIGGASLGRNVPALFTDDRSLAMNNLATTALAVIASRTWASHPILGYCVGYVVGSVLTNSDGFR